MRTKKRLDVLLFEKGLANSREKARAVIMSGDVYVDNQKADKPGTVYFDTAQIDVRKSSIPYVSRGGLKLEKAIKTFNINLKDKIAMDIGASTGGFTDCMLQNGARKVYCVDVGYGQLAWSLRTDERVVNLERTNIRYIDESLIKEKLDFLSIDVSFISLCLVLPIAKKLMGDQASAVCLIKPQFEAGREKVGKNGVVRDRKTHIDVIKKVCLFSQNEGFKILGLDFSPVKGPKGNIEYLLYLEKSDSKEESNLIDVEEVVLSSHLSLNESE